MGYVIADHVEPNDFDWNRRLFLQQMTASALAIGTALRPRDSWAARKQPKSMAEWMDAWAGVRSRDVSGGLYVYRFKDPTYALIKPIAWIPKQEQIGYTRVDVPVGFVTDFASIPPAFYQLLRPDGDYSYAAVFHDYLYWTQAVSRETADDVFRLAMMDFEIPRWQLTSIFKAVRGWGGKPWNDNARRKAAGEKRILAKFPDDPTTTWAAWKVTPGVFAP
jgi:hypothetical protein